MEGDRPDHFVIKPRALGMGATSITRADGAEWMLVKGPFVARATLAIVVGIVVAAIPFLILHLVTTHWRMGAPHILVPLVTLFAGMVAGGLLIVMLWPRLEFSLLTEDPSTSVRICERNTLLTSRRTYDIVSHDGTLLADVTIHSSMGMARRALVQGPDGVSLGVVSESGVRAMQRLGVQWAAGWLAQATRHGAAINWLVRRTETVRRFGSLDLDVSSAQGSFVGCVSIAMDAGGSSIAEIRAIDPRIVLLTAAVMAHERL